MNTPPTSPDRFYTGPALNADLLVTMLEKNGIPAAMRFARPTPVDEEDEFTREAVVSVGATDFERAVQLFYADRGDEL